MEMTILEKRTIVAEELAPVLKAFARELGFGKVRETLAEANINSSRKFGRELSDKLGSATITDFVRELKSWSAGGAWK